MPAMWSRSAPDSGAGRRRNGSSMRSCGRRGSPMVLDADGLNALQGCPERLDDRRGRATILTPHDGEFARLSGRTLEELASPSRADYACEFAERYGCCLVLKGHRTLIALPDGTLYRNTTGSSAALEGRQRRCADGADRLAPLSGGGRGGGRGARRLAARPRG